MEFVGQFLAAQPPAARATENNVERTNCPFAFVSLLTDDSFFPGVQTLVKSVQATGTVFPTYILIGSAVSAATFARLQSLCDGAERVETISCPYNVTTEGRSTCSDSTWVQAELTKLHVWNLTRFQKVVYLDADTLVVANIDELFTLPCSFAAAPDIFPPDRFNAGVMVIEPNAQVFRDMLAAVGNLPSYDGGDTGFLNSFFPLWYDNGVGPTTATSAPTPTAVSMTFVRLPFGYNAQRTLHVFTYKKQPGYWNAIKPLKIIHFSSSPKPWNVTPGKEGFGELEMIWWRFQMGI